MQNGVGLPDEARRRSGQIEEQTRGWQVWSPGLTAGQMEKVDADSALWLKNLQWMLAVHRRNPEAKFFVEQPQDPMEWMRETVTLHRHSWIGRRPSW